MDETQVFDAGVAAGNTAQATAQESADVKAWFKKIEDARDFDKNARKRYALDRRYARGDAGSFGVDVPIAPSYIDVLRSFLYAKDPDLDVLPARSTEPPPQSAILEKARAAVQADPMAQQQLAQAAQDAVQKAQQAALPAVIGNVLGTNPANQPPPPSPDDVAQQATQSMLEQLVQAKAKEMAAPFQQRRDDAKQFAATLEIVVAHLWDKARLKHQAEPLVGSTLTTSVGWIKAAWLERMGEDPIIRAQLNDMTDNLARLAETRRELDANEAADADALRAQYEQQIAGLQAKVEIVVARGFAIDFIAAEDVQVSPECRDLTAYRDAPWIAHRIFMTPEQAKADFPAVADKIKTATVYHATKPVDPLATRDVGAIAEVSASEADAYRKGGEPGAVATSAGNVCVWEVWNHDTSMVTTLIEGVDGYAKPPYAPNPASTRFYPFFLFAIGSVDGERHPKSLIARSQRLLDEYNRTRSNYAEHRRRCLPKLAFDATNYGRDEVAKLEAGGIGEMVPLKPLRPGEPVGNAMQPVAYPQVDMALYDTSAIRAELEMVWGIQEALSSSIQVAKTATEAEIQQQGTNSRTGYMRDALDEMLGDLAEYTSEVALQKMSMDDVQQVAGPWAFWPEGMTIDDLRALVTVDIRAGSTGKPDTTRQREAWATVMPLLQNAIVQVGQLRGSSPADIADCVEELVAETLQRTGDRLDVARFLPGEPDMNGAPQPMPSAITAPQPAQPTPSAITGMQQPPPNTLSNGHPVPAAAPQ